MEIAMNLFSRLVAPALLALALAVPSASAQERMWVRGPVAAVADDMLTIYVAGMDLNVPFAVDESSMVIAVGQGIVARPPERAPRRLAGVVTPGDIVEVHYARTGIGNYAAIIRLHGEGPAAGRSVTGAVSAISSDTVTVNMDHGQRTFVVEPATRIVARRSGMPERPALADLLSKNETVLVLYQQRGRQSVATEICTLPAPKTEARVR